MIRLSGGSSASRLQSPLPSAQAPHRLKGRQCGTQSGRQTRNHGIPGNSRAGRGQRRDGLAAGSLGAQEPKQGPGLGVGEGSLSSSLALPFLSNGPTLSKDFPFPPRSRLVLFQERLSVDNGEEKLFRICVPPFCVYSQEHFTNKKT